MSEPSISIVIPAYNVEGYIEDALVSVQRQSSPFTEIIVVNDGSTDKTLDIINKFAHLQGISIVTTKNRGLGAARNLGAAMASCEFLMFLDSDDFIHHDLVRSFRSAHAVDPLIDLYAFSFSIYDDTTKTVIPHRTHQYEREQVGIGATIFSELILDENFHSASWSYIFRKSLVNWKRNGFRNVLHEDEEFTPRLFISSKRLCLTCNIYYYYRQRAGSIMNSFGHAKFISSRIGYLVALFSCATLLPHSVGNKELYAALCMRLKYLSYHSFVPLGKALKSQLFRAIRKCLSRF